MIFDFALDSVENVQPWGESPNKSIHWFALTQGIYRLKVGEEYLLNYSDEFAAYLAKDQPDLIYRGSYVDYYVVRLWEDIIDMLPNILEPIPLELRHFFETDYKTQKAWYEKVDNWHEIKLNNGFDKDIIWDIAESATYWLDNRRLDSGYLSPSASIWIWSDERDVIVSWDNQENVADGLQVWTAIRGNYRIKREDFINELKNFDRQLFSQMEKRIDEICTNWKNSDIQIDFEQLKSEQLNRATWMNSWLNSDRKTDWGKIITAINLINSKQ